MAAADRPAAAHPGGGPAPADRSGEARPAAAWTGAAWTVRSAVRTFRREHPEVGDDVCVGLSGGADSLALLAAAVAEFDRVTALIVDHGLQAGSDEVARDSAAAARGLGAAAEILVVVVNTGGSGPEAEARAARYTALDAARRGRPVLLAHTLDDQAETVLLGLGRGSGARSLRGMASWDAPWGRPLLGVRAADTRAACRTLGLTWWDDPHNTDPAFTRVRLRHEVLPLLEDVLGGGAADGLARTAELLGVDDDELDRRAAEAYGSAVVCASAVVNDPGDSRDDAVRGEVGAAPGGGPSRAPHVALDVAVLEALPAAVLTRVIRRWLLAGGVASPTYVHLTAVAALVTDWRGQGGVAVGGSGAATAGGSGEAAPGGFGEVAPGAGSAGRNSGSGEVRVTRLVARRRHGKVVLEMDRASGSGS